MAGLLGPHPMELKRAEEERRRAELEKRILYCEVCEVPCRTPLDLQDHFKSESHKKKERAMMYGGFKVEELERIIQKIRCLEDYVNEKEREPLVGLEYVVEFRTPGMAEFDYNCELCDSRSKLIPMIVHLNGLKHRKAYISKHFPFSAKNRDPNEDLFQFLRRMSSEIECYRGLKMFRVHPPSISVPGVRFPQELSEYLKRPRWPLDEDPLEGEPRSKRFAGQDEFEENMVKAKRVAEILQRAKPLNKEEAVAMERAKALTKGADGKPSSENQIKSSSPLSQREPLNIDVKVWGRAAMMRKSASELAEEKQATAEKLVAEKRLEVEKRAVAEKLREEAEEEKHSLDRVAKAKILPESFTRGRGGPATQNIQSQGSAAKVDKQDIAEAKRPAETQNQINLPNAGGGNWNRASTITRSGVTSFGDLRKIPQDTLHAGMPLEKAYSAQHQEQWNRPLLERDVNSGLQGNSLRMENMSWRQPQPTSTPGAARALPDDSVVDILENFLQQSLAPEDQNVSQEGVQWNPEPLMRNQPSQFVTAGGTWNLVPMSQKEQIQQAVGPGNWNPELRMQNKVQQDARAPFYNQQSLPFGSSPVNQLNYQTQTPLSLLGVRDSNANVRQFDLPGTGSLSGIRGFGNEGNLSSVSSQNIRGGGPSSSSDILGIDFKAGNGLFRNGSQGLGANRMTDLPLNRQHELVNRSVRGLLNQGIKYASGPVNPSQGYLPGFNSFGGDPRNILQANADRVPLLPSPVGDSFREGMRSMALNRSLFRVADMGQNRMAGLSPDIVNQVRGKDAYTAWAILGKLSAYHPTLKNVNVKALVNQLVEMGIVQ